MSAERRSSHGEDEKPAVKCVVWDLDDTLWLGTLLEGDDLELTPRVKDVIQELDNRGILQSVASKNDYDAAMERLAAFGLDEYFLHPQISWANKSDSMKIIADRLGIGLDTFAFVDDQAFERDEIRYFLPEVTTIDAADIDTLLDMARMQPRFVTNESRIRRTMYQADIRRTQFEAEFPGSRREQFLETLGMCMTIRPAGEMDLRRAEELTIRTNQLNTTGRTYSYEVLNGLLNSPDHLLLVAELEDRYGTSGTIGLALIAREPGVWLVKLLITSCRVMTRGVGGIMISYILQSAKRSGVRLRAEFVANDRNRMMYMTYKFHGFYEVAAQDSFVLLEHDLESIRPFPRYVTVRSPSDDWANL
jgi:FkbH-like protein